MTTTVEALYIAVKRRSSEHYSLTRIENRNGDLFEEVGPHDVEAAVQAAVSEHGAWNVMVVRAVPMTVTTDCAISIEVTS